MPITVVSTAVKTATASGGGSTTVTLNCTAGGDFSPPPANGDFILASVHYDDDSGIPDFTGPAGWALIGNHQSVSAGFLIRGVNRRFAALPETTYTWTPQANGQFNEAFVLLAAVLRQVANPFALDPFQQFNANQADAANQSTPNVVMAHADSVLAATWGQDTALVNYSSVATVNGVTPTVIVGHAGISGATCRAALAIWLAPGAGTWHGVATEGSTSLGLWGSEIVGIRAAVLGSPQRTLVGTGT